MARIQYNPSAKRRGFKTQQLSTEGISRMREESNRIIQGMERQRRAEKEQRDENLRAMRENAAYTERITKENQAIQMQNLKNESMQKIANIQGASEQAAVDAAATESIIGSLVDFSESLQKTAAERTKRMVEDQTAEAAATPLEAFDPQDLEEYIDGGNTLANGGVAFNAVIAENAVATNEDPLETKKGYLSNPAYTGIKGRVIDNRAAYQVFTATLTARMQDTEKVYTAPNGQTYTGVEARANQYFMQDLKQKTKVDTFKYMGFSDPLYLADATKKINEFGDAQVSNARAEEFKRVDAALEQQYADIESAGSTEAIALAFDGRRKAFGAAKAHDAVERLYANNDIPLEVIDNLDINGDGKKYGDTWPNRRAAGIKQRQKNFVKLQSAEDAYKKAEDSAWLNANIDSIQQAYDQNPEQAAMLVKQRYYSKGMAVPTVIANIEREAIKKKRDIVENLVAQKTKFGNLDLTFVNSIQDPALQKTARAAYEQQELSKYGDEALGIKKGFKATARALTKINPNEEQGNAQTFLVQARLESEYLKQLKLTNDPLKALENVNQMVDAGRANDKSSPFYIDPSLGDNNRPVFPNIETSDREVAEMNTYIDKQILSSGTAVVDKPYALADSNQMDAAYVSAAAGVIQYPPGILKFAEQFGFKPSEVYNAQRQANNAATGANKPLLTPSPVTDLIDGVPPAMRKLFLSDVDAQVRRGGAMLTGNLPRRSNTGTQRQALETAAAELGVDPIDLATIIGFETGGTYDPNQPGGEGGNYQGLIQFGIPERQSYGVVPGMTFEEQLLGPVVSYFKDRFAKAGMSTQGADLLALYTTVLAGNPGANPDAKDSFGTSARDATDPTTEKGKIMAAHREAARKRYGF